MFRTKDTALLAIYPHMINNFLYLPDYPIGHLIAVQIEAQMPSMGGLAPSSSGWPPKAI